MWIITAASLSEHRDKSISRLLNDEIKTQEHFITLTYNRYNITNQVFSAKIYKKESGAEKFVKSFNSNSDKSKYSSRYYWVKDKHISYRKLTLEEWNSIIDREKSSLESYYKSRMSKLDLKRLEYK